MAGDFNSDFNADFSRVAVTGQLNAILTLRAALAGAHGVNGQLNAELAVAADLRGEFVGNIEGELNAVISINADLRGRVVRARERAPSGGGRFFGPLAETVPERLPEIPIPALYGKLNARLSVRAALAAEHLAPVVVLPQAAIDGRLLAGLIVKASLKGEALPRDESEDELAILLLAAA